MYIKLFNNSKKVYGRMLASNNNEASFLVRNMGCHSRGGDLAYCKTRTFAFPVNNNTDAYESSC